MANIAFSTPFTKSFTHSDIQSDTSPTQILAATAAHQKRVMLVIQNKDAAAIVQVIFNSTDTVGLELQPNQSCTLENYNGAVYAFSDVDDSVIHIAVALV